MKCSKCTRNGITFLSRCIWGHRRSPRLILGIASSTRGSDFSFYGDLFRSAIYD